MKSAILALSAVLALSFSQPARGDEETKEPQKLVLAQIKISGDLGERRAEEVPFGKPPLTYRNLLQLIVKAERDPEVRGVLLQIDELDVGMAKLQGLLHALEKFRKSGKKLYVHAEEMGKPCLFLASAADRVAMPPSGMVLIPGVAAEVLYLKGLFSLLGIEWLVVQEKEYKSAFENFVRDRMSPELREVLTDVVNQRYDTIVQRVSEGR
jgi:protease-4